MILFETQKKMSFHNFNLLFSVSLCLSKKEKNLSSQSLSKKDAWNLISKGCQQFKVIK